MSMQSLKKICQKQLKFESRRTDTQNGSKGITIIPHHFFCGGVKKGDKLYFKLAFYNVLLISLNGSLMDQNIFLLQWPYDRSEQTV